MQVDPGESELLLCDDKSLLTTWPWWTGLALTIHWLCCWQLKRLAEGNHDIMCFLEAFIHVLVPVKWNVYDTPYKEYFEQLFCGIQQDWLLHKSSSAKKLRIYSTFPPFVLRKSDFSSLCHCLFHSKLEFPSWNCELFDHLRHAEIKTAARLFDLKKIYIWQQNNVTCVPN